MREITNGRSYGFDTTHTYGTQCTGGAANTKGAWSQLVAATVGPTSFVAIQVDVDDAFTQNGGYQPMLIDIGIGAAGSEIVVVPNLYWSNAWSVARNAMNVVFPLDIPAGTRIAARCQASGAAFQNYTFVSIACFSSNDDPGFIGVVDYGTDTANSRGTALNHTTANTYGSWVQMAASVSRNLEGLFVLSDANLIEGRNAFAWNVGIGAAGSEKIIIPNMLAATGTGDSAMHSAQFFPIKVPSGSRLAMQVEGNKQGSTYMQTTGGVATSPRFILYGVY